MPDEIRTTPISTDVPRRPPARGAAAAIGRRRVSRDRARLGVRPDRAEQSHQRRRDRHRPHLARVTICLGIWQYATARIVAVCDVDSRRVADAKTLVNGYYTKKTGKPYNGVTTYADYRELLANRDIDAVVISTPDHWHALIAIHAVEAGKDVYLQKPASLTIAEGRALSNAVHRSGRIFQIGSQQRSSPQFRYAAELVRNGRIGQLKTVQVGLPGDPVGRRSNPRCRCRRRLNYDTWLGSTPHVYYTEKRVHPQSGYDRPGWLRCEQFGAGMITGWGAHHVDSAHWGMDTEYTGPIEIWGHAEFPKSGLWDVHGTFRTEGLYANGVRMIVSGEFPNGIRFEGTKGWIFVSRGNETVTASDPVAKLKDAAGARRERPEDHQVGHRARRNPPACEQRASRQLAREHPIAPAADRAGGSRAPVVLGVPAAPHRDEDRTQALLGSDQGTLQERRRGERDAVAAAALAVRDRLSCAKAKGKRQKLVPSAQCLVPDA